MIVIEHDLDVIKNADWVIDLGLYAGSAGGEIVFQGTPSRLVSSADSLTAEHVRRDLETGRLAPSDLRPDETQLAPVDPSCG